MKLYTIYSVIFNKNKWIIVIFALKPRILSSTKGIEGRRGHPACTSTESVTSVVRADDCFVFIAVVLAIKMMTVPASSATPIECSSEICS